MYREGSGREARFEPRSIDGWSASVLSADPSPSPLLSIMTDVIDVKLTNDPVFNPS